MIEEKTIHSWLEFVGIVNKFDVGPINKVNYIYRGHAVSSWKLTSSFHRIVDVNKLSISDLLEIEQEALKKFKTQAHQFLPGHVIANTKDVTGWWGLMQHYGAPTRFLDWSQSPFVAAYNVCIEYPNDTGAIWVLHNHSLDLKMRNVDGYRMFPASGESLNNEFFFSENSPSVIHALDIKEKTDRMVYQQGVFTVGQNVKDVQHDIITNALPINDGITKLAKIIIPAKLKINFLRNLHQMNVSANSLFPGIDGLGKSVNEYVKVITGQWGDV